MKRRVIYTAITNNYDKLIDDQPKVDGITYVCFTDNPELKSDTWNIVYVEGLNHKHPKARPLKYVNTFDESLWIDSNVQLTYNPIALFDYLNKKDIALFRAKLWDCAYQEAEVCKKHGLDSPEVIAEQIRFLKTQGYPENNGLHCGTVIARKHTNKVKQFNRLWWKQINQYSKRDQISLDYCLWKTKLRVAEFEGDLYENKFLKWSGTHAK